MLQKVFKSVIFSWLLLMVYCLIGGLSNNENDYRIIISVIMVPLAGGISGFVFHLIDRSQSKKNLNPYFLMGIKGLVFIVLVGIAFLLGLNGSY
jgi:hypothetical protein